jgi:hypothetical protein
LIGWHSAAIARRGMVFAPVLDDFEELLVGVVPGVAGLIVRWSREIPQRQALAPVGLAFEIASVTASAKAGVPLLAQGDVLGVVGVGLASGGICWRLNDYHPGQAWGYATQDNEQNTQPTKYRKNKRHCRAPSAARQPRRSAPGQGGERRWVVSQIEPQRRCCWPSDIQIRTLPGAARPGHAA